MLIYDNCGVTTAAMAGRRPVQLQDLTSVMLTSTVSGDTLAS